MSALPASARLIDYGVRFSKPVVVDPEAGAELSVGARVGAVEEDAVRIDLTVRSGEVTVLLKAQLRVAL